MTFRLLSRLVIASALTLALPGRGLSGSAIGDEASEVEPRSVAGLVVGLDGQPVPGAEVFGAFDLGESHVGGGLGPIHRATTDASGHFRLAWPDLATGRGLASAWVFQRGYRLSRTSVPSGQAGPAIRVVLNPASSLAAASLQVVGPGVGPIPLARIIPTRWFDGGLAATSARTWAIPPPLGDLVAAQTDPDGRAVLEAIPALRLSAVAVDSSLGSQVASWDESMVARHRQIKLRAVGRVVGQVKADDPAAVDGLTVRVTTLAGPRPVGLATTSTDRSGRFAIDKVAAGSVEVRVEPRSGGIELPEKVVRQALDPGGTLGAEVSLRRGVRVGGFVRERGQALAVAGAWIALRGTTDAPTSWVRTDGMGRFSAVVLAGPTSAEVVAAPLPFLVPSPIGKSPRCEVPDAIAGFEWPTIELDRGVVLRGRVVEDAGQPVEPGFSVEARWTRRVGRAHDEAVGVGWVSEDGRFEVGPVSPSVDVDLRVQRPGDRSGPSSLVAASEIARPVELSLPKSSAAIAPAGRVVDSTGRPVAGALIQFRVADARGATQGPRSGHRIATEGLDAVVTDDQGHFEAPAGLDARHRYIASAEASGCESGRTRAISGHSSIGRVLHFPDLVVHRHSKDPVVVVGRVVGTKQEPIGGVAVRDLARHQAITDDSGWFRIEDFGDGGPTFLFAQRSGYRFFGRSVLTQNGEADEPLSLVLTRLDEPATDRSMTRRGEDFAAQVMAATLARSVVNAFIERILARNDTVSTSVLLEHLAKREPGRVAAWLKAGVVADPRVADGLRSIASRKLAEADFDAAEALIASVQDHSIRALATLEAVDAAGRLEQARKKASIERVERDARSIEDLGRRVVVIARLAESWLNLGEGDQARRCLDEGQAMTELLPRATSGARAWCALIQPLARIDSKLAGKRLENLFDPNDSDRCRLSVALKLARVDPIEAARIFRRIRDPKLKVRAMPELCHLLALKDPAIARSLLDPIAAAHPSEAAYALGMMAASLAKADRQAATKLLNEAFARLEALVESGSSATLDEAVDPAAIASTLLPIVEAVDPSMIPEFFWKSVSLHIPRVRFSPRSEAILALLLDRYDPIAARLLFDPSRIQRSMIAPSDLSALMMATARLAPEIALCWAENRAEANEPHASTPLDADQAHLDLITAMTLSDQAQRDQATRRFLNLWTPGESLQAN